MKQSMIDNYINPIDMMNSTHREADQLAVKCSKWGMHNLLLRFRPPKIPNLQLVKVNPALEHEDEFSDDMFEAGGLLYDKRMNFYLELIHKKIGKPALANAGFLLAVFNHDEAYGWAMLESMIKPED